MTIQVRRPASIERVAIMTELSAKKKGKGGGNNEGAQPRERKEKDDVIEVCTKYQASSVRKYPADRSPL